MKTLIRSLSSLFVIIMIITAFAACGTDPNAGKDNPGKQEDPIAEKFTVTFANTSIESQSVEKGKTVSKPQDPKKDGYVFKGWYTDDTFKTGVSFPITVSSDVTVYAQFIEVFTVTFANTSVPSQTVEKGTAVSRPADPKKDGYIFGGWYIDKDFQTEAEFPIVVTSDQTVYAQFFSYEEAFRKARNNTIGDSVPGFAYNYTLEIGVTYASAAIKGNTVGSVQYSNTGDVNFYDEHVNSGALFYDGSKYQIRRGSSLQNIALNKDGKIVSFSVEEVDATYKYDSSSFAKAVFAYSDDQLKSIAPTEKENEYKLSTAMNASTIISLIGNYINHPTVERILGKLPETSVNSGLYVTFANGKIDSYKYEMNINVSSLQLTLLYTLKFTDSGKAISITPRDFAGIALSPADIQNLTNEASEYINAFKAKTQSGYDFVVKTGVDYGATSGEINSTFKGSAMRKVENGNVFFHNDIEIDSDYKNADLFKDAGIADIHIKETMLTNGEVHLIEKKLLTDSTQQVENFTPDENTSYYLFDILSHTGKYSFAEKENQDGQTIYTFGLSNSGVAELLTWMNASLDLDPLKKATVSVPVFGSFDATSIIVNTGKLIVTVKDGTLDSVQVTVEGDFTTAFAGSVDFSAADMAQIKLDYSLMPNVKGDSFVPFETVKAAK